jgi:hypothetical protein
VNYYDFLLFATRRLKWKFSIVEFWVRGFLRKYELVPRTIESYLLYSKKKNLVQIAKQLGVDEKTIRRDLEKLQFVSPELFVENLFIPEIPQMYFPTNEEWEEIERLDQIKEKF